MDIKIKIPDLNKQIDKLERFPKTHSKNLTKAMSSSLGILQALAIQESPIRTGWLRRNIKWDAPKASHGRLEARADYSLYVERGVAGTARNPNPFMRRARDKGKSKVEKQFRQAIQKTLNETKI